MRMRSRRSSRPISLLCNVDYTCRPQRPYLLMFALPICQLVDELADAFAVHCLTRCSPFTAFLAMAFTSFLPTAICAHLLLQPLLLVIPDNDGDQPSCHSTDYTLPLLLHNEVSSYWAFCPCLPHPATCDQHPRSRAHLPHNDSATPGEYPHSTTSDQHFKLISPQSFPTATDFICFSFTFTTLP